MENRFDQYDYVVVGAGLYGATTARLLVEKGYKVLVIEKSDHVAGNIYTKLEDGIHIHVYGAHIFHTSFEDVWSFVTKYASMTPFINSPIANYKGELYHLPFNMNTFHELWGVNTVEEAKAKIAEQVAKENIVDPKNLEEQVLSMAGRDVYLKLVKGYTEKQWGRDCKDLPSSIIKRLPFRFEYNNNYFNDIYQGIPKDGYTQLVLNILDGIKVELNFDFFDAKDEILNSKAKVVYTGPIDSFFDYSKGHLEYRSLKFETEKMNTNSYLGIPVMNFTSSDEKYTRIIEHKFFDKFCMNDHSTFVTREYPASFEETKIPYYPINDDKNNSMYSLYEEVAKSLNGKVYFGGRLGLYKYFDMDDAIKAAIDFVASI